MGDGKVVCLDGTCVQCTQDDTSACTGTTPVCDTTTNTCVPCSFHRECPDSACHIDTGECFDPSEKSAIDSSILLSSINAVPAGGNAVFWVSGSTQVAATTIDTGRAIAILNVGGMWAVASDTNFSLNVSGTGTRAYLSGVVVGGGYGALALNSSAVAYLDETKLFPFTIGTGTLIGASISTGAHLYARNSYALGAPDAILVNSAAADLLYTTVWGTASTGARSSIRCTGPVTVNARNSFLFTSGGTAGDEIACLSAHLTYSATEGPINGMGNQTVGDAPASIDTWYPNLFSGTGDVSISSSLAMLLDGVALWKTGDPGWDINGDARPMVDGTPDYAGSDVPSN